MNHIKDIIEAGIKGALEALAISIPEIPLEHPADLSHGDYSTSVALVAAKESKINPKELAEKIKVELEQNLPSEIEKVEVAGLGFINFYLSKKFFAGSISEINKTGTDFGKNNVGKGKTVLVEYSSPNIAKPFTVGHLRSTIIGDSITRILEFSGYKIIRDNHIGDWGTQFGKLIVAVKKWGDFSNIQKEEFPVKALVDLYVKFHEEAEKDPLLEDEAREWFSKIEKGDKEAKAIWQKCVDLSLTEFSRIYQRLNILSFDTIHGESFFEDKMAAVLADVREKNLGKESEGAYLIFFDEGKKLPPLMLLKKDGSSVYALRDLATDRYRKEEYGSDISIINEVGAEQSLYFRQIFEAEEMLGYFPKGQRIHIAHGLYRFKEGKMATRKGNVIWLEEVIDEAVKRAAEYNPESAEAVAIGAIKFNDLKRESIKDIVFDWEEILNLKGDSGPYLQYSTVRANSILAKAKSLGIETSVSDSLPSITTLEHLLYRFPEIVEFASTMYAPSYIATYLLELSSAFNAFYAEGQIVNKADKESPYKVALTEAFATVMKNGLYLLGIEVPEKM